MLSASLARALAARGIHYGWFMVALTMGYLLCSSATLSIPGVLLTPMSRDLGWSIGDLSGPLGLRVALFGLVAPFAGGLMLLYGPRAVITGSATLLIVGLLLSMTMTEKWELWLGLGIILGIASGMTALILAVTVATRWFTARRGLVTGILSAGTATGQLIFLPMAAWRAALMPSIFMIGLLAAAFVLFSRDRPSDLGLAPFGEEKVQAMPPRPRAT